MQPPKRGKEGAAGNRATLVAKRKDSEEVPKWREAPEGSQRPPQLAMAFAVSAGTPGSYGAQSATKTLVSCGLPLRLLAKISFFPSEVNMGKPSKVGL